MASEGSGFIGKTTTVRGTLRGEGELVVEGNIEGTVELTDQLLIQPGGSVNADVNTANLVVHGQFQGTVNASALVAINSGAQVVGDVSAPRVIIEDGAHFKGRIEMKVELPDDLAGRK